MGTWWPAPGCTQLGCLWSCLTRLAEGWRPPAKVQGWETCPSTHTNTHATNTVQRFASAAGSRRSKRGVGWARAACSTPAAAAVRQHAARHATDRPCAHARPQSPHVRRCNTSRAYKGATHTRTRTHTRAVQPGLLNFKVKVSVPRHPTIGRLRAQCSTLARQIWWCCVWAHEQGLCAAQAARRQLHDPSPRPLLARAVGTASADPHQLPRTEDVVAPRPAPQSLLTVAGSCALPCCGTTRPVARSGHCHCCYAAAAWLLLRGCCCMALQRDCCAAAGNVPIAACGAAAAAAAAAMLQID